MCLFSDKELYDIKYNLVKDNYKQFNISDEEFEDYEEIYNLVNKKDFSSSELFDNNGNLLEMSFIVYHLNKVDFSKVNLEYFILLFSLLENINDECIYMEDIVEVCESLDLDCFFVKKEINRLNGFIEIGNCSIEQSIAFKSICKISIFDFMCEKIIEKDDDYYPYINEILNLFNNKEFLELWELNYGK